MKIAIVGTGISGMTAAWLLNRNHEVTVFEQRDRIGGHTHTVRAETPEGVWDIDTGFIVFNDWTYPNFIKLMELIDVETQESNMSFSVSKTHGGLEYAGTSLSALFADRSNLFRPSHYGMLLDIVRFNKEAKLFLRKKDDVTSLTSFLEERRYGKAMIEYYLVPMMAAIWSADPFHVRDFPARHFFGFFENHGLLNVKNRPAWRVVKGGSSAYARRLTQPFESRIRLSSPIESILRDGEGVQVKPRGGSAERFDHVVIAAHSDQALKMLGDPSEPEREILGAIPYQANDVVLHTDDSIMPRNARARASWNYHLHPGDTNRRATVTYWMNLLQNLDAPRDFLVTLNDTDRINPDCIIRKQTYYHPVYSSDAMLAQKHHNEISGVRNTHYCGAYWGYGFHEDGVKSALAACEFFSERL